MSTRPLPPPELLRDDPGPWGVVSSVFAQAGRPGRRRPQPPMGLMLSPPPEIGRPLAGLDAASGIVGVGRLAVLAAAREPASALAFEGDALTGVSPSVRRAWSIPDLKVTHEERPGDDPAAEVPPAVHPAAIEDADLVALGGVPAPGGGVTAVVTREGRFDVVALVRDEDRAIVRWIRGPRAVAWSADGALLALGGSWGVLLAGRKG